jgi:hypothetical protein
MITPKSLSIVAVLVAGAMAQNWRAEVLSTVCGGLDTAKDTPDSN